MPNFLFGKRVKWLFNYDGFPHYNDIESGELIVVVDVNYTERDRYRCNFTDKNGYTPDDFPYWYVPKQFVIPWDDAKMLNNDYYS